MIRGNAGPVSLGISPWQGVTGGGTISAALAGGLPAYAFETEASAYIARISSAPSAPRQFTINRLIKRLKDAGVWSKIDAAWIIGADEQSWTLNLKSASFTLSKVSTPTFTANVGVAGSNTAYYDTTWNPSTNGADINDFHVSCVSATSTPAGANDLGLVSTNGIAIDTITSSGGNFSYRVNGAAQTTTGGSVSDGSGHTFVQCNGTTASLYYDGKLVESQAYTPAAAVNLSLHILRVNNASSSSGRQLSFVSVGKVLTATQARDFACAVREYTETVRYGDLDEHLPGYAPYNVSKDFIVYGATAQGVMAAYEAARQGRSVAIVGGWRERGIGGMSTGGLGFVDMDNTASVGGLPRWLITRINAIYGRADSTYIWEPRMCLRAMRGLLDATQTGGLAIPIYWSTGVSSVAKSGARITSFTTADNRTFVASQFHDASYEGDLMARAGVGYIVGREAAGSGNEASNGYRGINMTWASSTAQAQFAISTTRHDVDPYLTPGNAGSGLIAGVNAAPVRSVGDADSEVQSYSFRLTASNNKIRRVNVPASQPSGYSIATYEPLLRFLKKLTDDGLVYTTNYDIDTMARKADALVTNIYDFNSRGGQSTDKLGGSWSYPEATYAQREVIWKAHETYMRGLLYTWCYARTNEADTRMPAAFETASQAYGFDARHYVSPHPNDEPWWPTQLYVREARRMVSDTIWNANDLTAVDGTTPRSVKTVAVASYAMDRKAAQMMEDAGSSRIHIEGITFVSAAGGVNNESPVPYEICVPKAAECTNLSVSFCLSITGAAFGSTRMELCAMEIGQAMGLAAAVAIETGNQNIQDVDYPTLRTRLLASNTNSGEVVPVLPQLN